jgi:hypothetical protein
MVEEVAADSCKFGSSMDEEAAEKMDYKDEWIYCLKRISGRTIDFGGSWINQQKPKARKYLEILVYIHYVCWRRVFQDQLLREGCCTWCISKWKVVHAVYIGSYCTCNWNAPLIRSIFIFGIMMHNSALTRSSLFTALSAQVMQCYFINWKLDLTLLEWTLGFEDRGLAFEKSVALKSLQEEGLKI